MRTTLNIANDVLLAAKEIARRNQLSVGAVLSDLARQGLRGAQPRFDLARLGIHPLPQRGGVVTNDIIDRMRDVEGV